MKQPTLFFAVALAFSSGVQAQSNEELKKTVQDLQNRVKTLEQQKQVAPAVSAAGVPVVAPGSTAGRGCARREQGAHRDFRPGDARCDLRLQARRSGLECHVAAVEDPGQLSRRSRLRQGWRDHLQRPPDQARLQGLHPDHDGRAHDAAGFRPVRQRRRHHACARAPCLGRAGAVRGGTDRHAVHGHRRLPQHHRLLGPERHGVRAQPAGALHGRSTATA